MCDLRSPRVRGVVVALCAALIGACNPSGSKAVPLMLSSATAVARESRLVSAIADSAVEHDATEPLARWILPASLREISGLALTRDGRLLTHTDESGQVWEVDYRRGVLVKHFWVGDALVKGDFEGITMVGDTVWMLTSKGMLYGFAEGADDAHVAFVKYDTGLRAACEFEGIAYDPKRRYFLLACKHVLNKAMKTEAVIYRLRVPPDTSTAPPPLVLTLADVRGENTWAKIEFSDITIDPLTGNYVLVASRQKALFSITPDGALVFARPLPPGHAQAEGLAITSTGMLVVSDEGTTEAPAIITVYRWP